MIHYLVFYSYPLPLLLPPPPNYPASSSTFMCVLKAYVGEYYLTLGQLTEDILLKKMTLSPDNQ